jgi:hypothetical protein
MKNLLKFVLFTFSFGIFVSCGSGGESGGNSNGEEFVFPKQEYVRCYDNEVILTPFKRNGQEIFIETIPATGCSNVIEYRNESEKEGVFLFTIAANSGQIILNYAVEGNSYKPYYVYKKNDKLVFYAERVDGDNPFKPDTLNTTNLENVKICGYTNIDLPDFKTKEDFFNFVNNETKNADYVLGYFWYEVPGFFTYYLGYLKGKVFVRGSRSGN